MMRINAKTTGMKTVRRILVCLLFCGIFAPLICNELPYYVRHQGKNHFPALYPEGVIISNGDTIGYRTIDFRIFTADDKWMAPVVYSATTMDNAYNSGISPFSRQTISDGTGQNIELPVRYKHWLGTTKTGKDVLACIVFGIRNALAIGGLSSLLAVSIGFVLGFMAGYFGNDKMIMRRGNILTAILVVSISLFEISKMMESRLLVKGLIACTSIIALVIILHKAFLSRLAYFSKPVKIPVDGLINSFTSGFMALPQLVLILGIMTVLGPSYSGVIACIGLTSWPLMARAIRSEALKLQKETFIESANASGISPLRIAWKHYLPNMNDTFRVVSLTGFTAAILTEAGLSFLGAGLPAGSNTWGGLMAEARNDLGSWWLVVFPGMALTISSLALSRLSIGISRKKD